MANFSKIRTQIWTLTKRISQLSHPPMHLISDAPLARASKGSFHLFNGAKQLQWARSMTSLVWMRPMIGRVMPSPAVPRWRIKKLSKWARNWSVLDWKSWIWLCTLVLRQFSHLGSQFSDREHRCLDLQWCHLNPWPPNFEYSEHDIAYNQDNLGKRKEFWTDRVLVRTF